MMQAPYTMSQISDMYGYSLVTTWRHIKKLKEKGTFIKSSVGNYFSEEEAQQLSKLLSFSFPPK